MTVGFSTFAVASRTSSSVAKLPGSCLRSRGPLSIFTYMSSPVHALLYFCQYHYLLLLCRPFVGNS